MLKITLLLDFATPVVSCNISRCGLIPRILGTANPSLAASLSDLKEGLKKDTRKCLVL